MKLPPDSGQIGRGTVQTLCERKRSSDSALEEAGKKEPYKKTPIRFCAIPRYISQNFFPHHCEKLPSKRGMDEEKTWPSSYAPSQRSIDPIHPWPTARHQRAECLWVARNSESFSEYHGRQGSPLLETEKIIRTGKEGFSCQIRKEQDSAF